MASMNEKVWRDGLAAPERDAEIASLRAELASRQIDVETFSEANRQLRAAARQDAEEPTKYMLWAEIRLRDGKIRQDADTIEALRRTLDSVRSDRDASDAEIRRLKARSAEEMARLTDEEKLAEIAGWAMCRLANGGGPGKCSLSTCACGVEGIAVAKAIRAALACRPQGAPSGIQQAEEIAGARQALAACYATIEKDAEEIARLKEALEIVAQDQAANREPTTLALIARVACRPQREKE